nr:RNA-directed DNA polymerase-like [Ipomoea batatas]
MTSPEDTQDVSTMIRSMQQQFQRFNVVFDEIRDKLELQDVAIQELRNQGGNAPLAVKVEKQLRRRRTERFQSKEQPKQWRTEKGKGDGKGDTSTRTEGSSRQPSNVIPKQHLEQKGKEKAEPSTRKLRDNPMRSKWWKI